MLITAKNNSSLNNKIHGNITLTRKKIINSDEILDRIIKSLESVGISGHGKNVRVAESIGYSANQVGLILAGKYAPNDRFIKSICTVHNISEHWIRTGEGEQFNKQPTPAINEQLIGYYSPEVRLAADYLEVKVKGKTPEERLRIVEEIMADIRNKYK